MTRVSTKDKTFLKFLEDLWNVAVAYNTYLSTNKLFDQLFPRNKECTVKFCILTTNGASRLNLCRESWIYSRELIYVPIKTYADIESHFLDQYIKNPLTTPMNCSNEIFSIELYVSEYDLRQWTPHLYFLSWN